MSITAWSSLLALLAVSVRLAGAAEFTGYGPVPVRNFQPVQLIFLNMPVERARVLPTGALQASIESVESNTIATDSNDIIDAQLKFESNRTVLGFKAGVAPGLELGVDLPFISRFGGFLDPFIDGVEDLFGINNVERHLYPDNTFGAFYIRQRGVTLFEGGHETFQPGDMWFTGKWQAFDRAGWPLVSLRGALKAPTGNPSHVTGSGKPDFGLGLASEYQPLSWLVLYANLNGIFPVGPVTQADLTLNPMATQAFAIEVGSLCHLSLLIQEDLYTSPFHGTGTRMLDDTLVELTAALTGQFGPVQVQLAGINNVTGVISAADFSLFLRMNYLFGPASDHPPPS